MCRHLTLSGAVQAKSLPRGPLSAPILLPLVFNHVFLDSRPEFEIHILDQC